ncbi:hypothetical protein [Nocardia gipuzkoensis]
MPQPILANQPVGFAIRQSPRIDANPRQTRSIRFGSATFTDTEVSTPCASAAHDLRNLLSIGKDRALPLWQLRRPRTRATAGTPIWYDYAIVGSRILGPHGVPNPPGTHPIGLGQLPRWCPHPGIDQMSCLGADFLNVPLEVCGQTTGQCDELVCNV